MPLFGCGTAIRNPATGAVVSDFELIPIRVTRRTVWLILRLHTDAGLSGLGEASNAFGSANTTVENAALMRAECAEFFSLIANRSPLDIEHFRQNGRRRAQTGLVSATAYSAIEQALWDLAGQVLDVPTYRLFGGKVRNALPVYANVNRAANPRTPEGFAAIARRARDDGFRAMKAAPFDGFPVEGTAAEIAFHIERGIETAFAMREAVGNDTALMIDCHSFFSESQAVAVAERLEPVNLAWYEEPVPPDRVDSTLSVKESIVQSMAGGELLFGIAGFKELIQRRAFDVIMPDVKHCGGLTELIHIAAMAAEEGILVAPHNPSGPVSTVASIQVSAGMANFNYLELQYGEVDWRTNTIRPAEIFVDGMIEVPDSPGFGIALNEAAVRENSLPL